IRRHVGSVTPRRSSDLHVAFVRSPYPAANLLSIDAEEARKAPGVAAVLTISDLDADGVRDFALPVSVPHVSGGVTEETPRPLLVDRKSTRLNSSHVKIS